MLVFIDESGDIGFKLNQGSSPFFTIAAVVWEDMPAAAACDHRIDAFRRELGLPQGFEFRYARNRDGIKERFLGAVAPFPFTHHVFTLDKAAAAGAEFQHSDRLYAWCVGSALENAVTAGLKEAAVVIDKSGSRAFRDQLRRLLNARIGDRDGVRILRSVKSKRSAGNNLLQLADYVAGAATRVLREEALGTRLWRSYLRNHERSWEVWPQK